MPLLATLIFLAVVPVLVAVTAVRMGKRSDQDMIEHFRRFNGREYGQDW